MFWENIILKGIITTSIAKDFSGKINAEHLITRGSKTTGYLFKPVSIQEEYLHSNK